MRISPVGFAARSVAEAFYGVPEEIAARLGDYLPDTLAEIVKAFRDWSGKRALR